MRLRGILVSARSALRTHPEDAPDIVRRAGQLLDQLEIEVIEAGSDQLVIEIAAVRSRLRHEAGTDRAPE